MAECQGDPLTSLDLVRRIKCNLSIIKMRPLTYTSLYMRKDYYTEERLKEMGLNDRQIKAVMYVKEKGRITNREYQELNFVSNKTAYLELSDIIKKNVFAVEGSGRTVAYTLKVTKK